MPPIACGGLEDNRRLPPIRRVFDILLQLMQQPANRSDPADKINPDYASAFTPYLDPGERMLWFGQPRKGIFLRPADLGMIPFSLMWGGFAIFWEVMALSSTRKGNTPLLVSTIFPLWGIPFVVIGLYMIFGRFFVDAWLRERTYYGLSDRRAMILTGWFNSQLVSYEINRLEQTRFTTHTDGTATIHFRDESIFNRRSSRSFSWAGQSQTAFEHIAEGAQVYRLIREIQQPEDKQI